MLSLEPELRGGVHQRCCDSCGSAVYCRADAASLCSAASPLARRHRRVPMGAGGAFLVRPPGGSSSWPIRDGRRRQHEDDSAGEEEATSWLPLDDDPLIINGADDLVADFLDLGGGKEDASSWTKEGHGKSGEFVVPGEPAADERQAGFVADTTMAYDASNFRHGYGYGATTLGHSVSLSSSLDTRMGPDDECATPDITSSSFLMRPSSNFNCSGDVAGAGAGAGAAAAQQVMAMDREARVHRYREKRKTRKFDKTIRYASRKAYAETRPRIKGRFAKRTDADHEVDQYFVVPTF